MMDYAVGMGYLKTTALFAVTAVAEIVGCYLPWLWLRQAGSVWLLVPAAVSLALFAWLLTLHPAASGRIYAAYGGVYVAAAIVWLWLVDGIRPTGWDVLGGGCAWWVWASWLSRHVPSSGWLGAG